jgi:gas vesicle protein
MKHVDECIELSQKIIDKEHELDLSKQSDRAKLDADFLKEILQEVKDNIADVVEETIDQAEETVEDVAENTEATDDVVEDIPAVEEDIILLENPEELDEFEKQICPFCHESKLEASGIDGNKISVKCSNCSKEFSVDSETNQIFAKMR